MHQIERRPVMDELSLRNSEQEEKNQMDKFGYFFLLTLTGLCAFAIHEYGLEKANKVIKVADAIHELL
jgi:hypothetical protein